MCLSPVSDCSALFRRRVAFSQSSCSNSHSSDSPSPRALSISVAYLCSTSIDSITHGAEFRVRFRFLAESAPERTSKLRALDHATAIDVQHPTLHLGTEGGRLRRVMAENADRVVVTIVSRSLWFSFEHQIEWSLGSRTELCEPAVGHNLTGSRLASLGSEYGITSLVD